MTEPLAFQSLPFAAGAGGIYLTGEDNLRLTTWGALAGLVVTLEGRYIDAEGCSVPFVETQIPSANRSAVTQIFAAREGLLTNLQLRVSTGTVAFGLVAAIVEIVRGKSGGVTPMGTILQGYVSSAARLAWPGSPILSLPDGPGRVRSVQGTAPAAGAEISETVPTNARWRLYAVAFAFTASAAVANRRPVLTITDGLGTLWETSSAVDVTAAQLATYRAGADVGFFTYGTRAYHLPLPSPIPMGTGFVISTVTSGIDGGDQYSLPRLLVEEWIDL